MHERFEKARELVKKYNQEHLLRFYHLLSQYDKDLLINEILVPVPKCITKIKADYHLDATLHLPFSICSV
ncbi:MAG: hypothetical protein K0R54_3391 [Clostridiaceae bacterium]|nr:hypothetical protein [Clostridiaceae bacterium]